MQNKNTGQVMVGDHVLWREVLSLARRVAQSDLAVNIFGETGTGKELLARFIHAESHRRNGPFVTVDCGILATETARSELFGHVRGAFTGAQTTHLGLVAKAAGGTLFLDEVGELDLNLQLQLLRLIQEGTFRRMGDTHVQKVDVRVVTATHRDLAALVDKKQFRADLFYRLQMVPLTLPPLRFRQSDILILAEYFLGLFSGKGQNKTFTPLARQALMRYDWPGNIRELQHEIARLVLMVESSCIDESDLADKIRGGLQDGDVYDLPFKEARKIALQRFMREYLHRQLLRSEGNVTEAAKESGVGRQYFQMRMAECGVHSKAYKMTSLK